MASSIESTTSVQAKNDDQSSTMLESSLSTTSVAQSTEISEAADNAQNSVMLESSRPRTPSVITEISEAEDEPSSGPSSPRSSSSEEIQVNPIIEELRLNYPDIGHGDFNPSKEPLQNVRIRLKKELEDGKGKIPKFLDRCDISGAKEQVQKVLWRFDAIQFVSTVLLPKHRSTKVMDDIKESKVDMGEDKQMKDGDGDGTTTEDSLVDLYRTIFTYDLQDYYSNELSTVMRRSLFSLGNKRLRYRHTEFMVFLVKKVQKETTIMDGLGDPRDCAVAKCISEYEEESFASCILHVRQGELEEAIKMLKETIKSIKHDDTWIINRGRVYNSVLQEAFGHQVQILGSHLQLLPKDLHRKNNCLLNQDLTKIQDYFVDVFLGDKDFMQQLTFDWMEEHKYSYLILCVWECLQRQKKDEESQYYTTTGVDQKSFHFKTKRHSLDISKLCKPTGTGDF